MPFMPTETDRRNRHEVDHALAREAVRRFLQRRTISELTLLLGEVIRDRKESIHTGPEFEEELERAANWIEAAGSGITTASGGRI